MNRFIIVAIGVLGTSVATAQPAGAQAEVLFREGRDLMSAGKLAEACNAFEESQRLEAGVTTLLNLAGCRERNGQLATAWGLFLEAERQTRSATDAVSRQLHSVAQERANKLEPRVSKLAINVPEKSQVDGLQIARASEHVEAVMWNRALPIDGGTYTITAHAPGTNTWSTQVSIAVEGETKTVEIPDLKTLQRDLAPPPRRAVQVKAPTSSSSSSKLWPIGVSAGAAMLLGGSVAFELWGNATYNEAKAEMLDQSRRDSLYSSANTKRYTAEAFAVTGIAAAGVAVWLFLRHDDEPSPVTARHQLVVSPSGVAFFGAF